MNNNFDNPAANDNRRYDYSRQPSFMRDEYGVIVELVDKGSHVIDLGSGNGSLLHLLREKKSITGTGVELSPTGAENCRQKGFETLLGRIDEPLPYRDNEFDYAICNVTLQMVMYPEILLKEMKRIARRQIISFPNFAFYKNRLDLLLHGRMPHPLLFGYFWFSTGHVHQLSLEDFKDLLFQVGGMRIQSIHFTDDRNPVKGILKKLFPNLLNIIPIILIEKSE
jgi:methionine biosynthesis protein MetW